MDAEELRAVLLLKVVGGELRDYLRMDLETHGISEGRIRVLGYLLQSDAPATHSQLADATGVTKGTVTGLIDGLESDGYVRRFPCENDRRVSLIEMTREGHALLQRIMPSHLQRLSELMSGLSKDERKTLIELLEKTRTSLRPSTNGNTGAVE